jgi:hypothetical protein
MATMTDCSDRHLARDMFLNWKIPIQFLTLVQENRNVNTLWYVKTTRKKYQLDVNLMPK